ncbi:hypothetical protein [Primorskyibacter sp. S187A]|uniref:hypothetical protein n=1 Tax=Primorskyibacter sp. S187A TaxID=3415130 RepID=UPI003C7AD167
MGESFWIEDTRAVVVTRNTVEAADLAMALDEKSVSPVLCLRSAYLLSHLLDNPEMSIALVVLGVTLDDDQRVLLAAKCSQRRCRILILDDGDARAGETFYQTLARPFDAESLDHALSAVGLASA